MTDLFWNTRKTIMWKTQVSGKKTDRVEPAIKFWWRKKVETKKASGKRNEVRQRCIKRVTLAGNSKSSPYQKGLVGLAILDTLEVGTMSDNFNRYHRNVLHPYCYFLLVNCQFWFYEYPQNMKLDPIFQNFWWNKCLRQT